jgi:putative transposase
MKNHRLSIHSQAIDQINETIEVPMTIRQVKCLNNIDKHDHRAVKTITIPMLSFKSFKAEKYVLARIKLMYMIRKTQSHFMLHDEMSFAD